MGNARMRCHSEFMTIGKSIRLLMVLGGLLFTLAGNGWAGDFIRVKQTDELAKLQTAMFRYEKDGVQVDLIGAIHLADRQYYEFLNDHFKQYEVLLFEMVGGENLGGVANLEAEAEMAEEDDVQAPPEADDGKEENRLAGLTVLYSSMQELLGLEGQAAVIDYMAKNFVHADLTMDEFEALQDERGESLFSFMLMSGLAAERPEVEPNAFRLLGGLLSGRSDLVKLEMMETMAAGDTQIDAIAGENVIITDRNAKCMEVLDRQIAAGKKKIGIFYGAAHFPDLERRLQVQGFKRTFSKWVNAWVVKKP